LKLGFKVFVQNPVVGVGPGGYPFLFKGYAGELGTDGFWLSTVHNEFVLRAAETGIVGSVLFILSFWYLLIASWKLIGLTVGSDRVIAIGLFAGLVGVVWIMCWVPWTGFGYNAAFWLLGGVLTGQLSVEQGYRERVRSDQSPEELVESSVRARDIVR
jgi:O-antigen ligase